MGPPTMTWVTGLPSGVMTAATMKMSSTAYLKFACRNPAVTMPSRASTNIKHRQLEDEAHAEHQLHVEAEAPDRCAA